MSSQLSASLLRLKLLDALRAGEEAKVDSIINELKSVESTVDTTELVRLGETILHYAVQVAPLPMLQHLVENPDNGLDINSQDVDGNTPLHLAAAASRYNVVKYLLSLPEINDTIINADKKQPVELARDANIAQLMQFERAKFVEQSATLLRQYFSTRDFANLENLLVNNPRASELLDINGADPETGNTVLHEFIGKEDFKMCDWILSHGGDPFKRDKRGKLPIDLVSSKSDPIRKLLKHASKDQNIMDPVANSKNALKAGSAPTYKGYLRKWTNFASGYKLRYFVLDQYGILSYYANQGDTNNACRGSLNLGYATLHLDSSEKLKFEIIGKNGIKWHLKANQPVETNRWVWTLQNATTLAKDNIRKRKGVPSPTLPTFPTEESLKSGDDRGSIDEEKKRRLLHIPGRRKHKKSPSLVSLASFTGSDAEDTASINSSFAESKAPVAKSSLNPLVQIEETKAMPSNASVDGTQSSRYGGEDFDYDLDEQYDSGDSDSDSDINSDGIPMLGDLTKLSRDSISATKRSIEVELASLVDLFKALGSSHNTVDTEPYHIGLRTLTNVQNLIEQYHYTMQARDLKLLKKIERQGEVNKLWESSIRLLETDIQKREETLTQYEGKKYKLRKLLASNGISSPQVTNEVVSGYINANDVKSKGTKTTEEKALFDEIFRDSDDEFFDADDFDESETEELPAIHEDPVVAAVSVTDPVSEKAPVEKEELKETTEVPPTRNESETETVATISDAQREKQKVIEDEGSFLGYEKPPRSRLAMDEDNRPKVGLWGILKSMIGKDMTRMTLPVSFNECTSLLQRLAEDVEYNSLLETAAGIEDSTLRMVYVATFAASLYASTIGRVAKPFNPLLGETFEYCRKDQNFRLISEQVSHHPPISACNAESVKWDYYGENAVDSQFKGRSFDFKHLGKMFCNIRPDSGVITSAGKTVQQEVYSWKKVNTSVVGIIMGNPTVDNYGKMEVRNHTTGDVCIIDMKQRGWKASSAYQLSGVVQDAKQNTQWAIGGHWDSTIYAKKVTGDLDSKRRASLIEAVDVKETNNPLSGNKFLVWEAAARPKVPFNLTSFALTLNDPSPDLIPWLAPTDTRLRPDQRAMEDGLYDLASDEKHRVEEKQRAARKERDTKHLTYKPNWFIKLQHPVTGDHYWEFNEQYWKKRMNKELSGTGDIF